MTLTSGSRVGPYEIHSVLGAGGMGEVYRARDTALKRDVALKVLPQQFTADPERLARFQREAELLASLNHPHIAQIYGVAEADGVRALVLELVEGPTLADRITRGAVPVTETLVIARQVAEALEAAHDQGIVHRDLKPANIKVRPDGAVKVLDFGLAKAMAGESVAPVLANSPTASHLATRAGVLLGTAAYMSPEQARGLPLDARTDIWSFGCVLYEMLTGRMAFAGPTVTDILSAIVSREPDWASLPAETPDTLRRLLRHCLAKDANRRLHHVGDARIELDDVAEPSVPPAVMSRHPRALLPLAVTAVVALALGAGAARWLVPTTGPAEPIAFTVVASGVAASNLPGPALSPDGRHLALVGIDETGRRAIWLRTLASVESRRIDGTEGVALGDTVFWAPDGRSLGFFAEGRLRKVELAGGLVQAIAPITSNLGATWNQAGVIVLAPHNRVPLHRVPSSGGTPQVITELSRERRENSHRWPHFLPDGRHFLYTARSDVKENTGIYVGSLESNDRKWLLAAQSNAQYAPPGHLLFVRDGTLMAQPFDVGALELRGEPVALAGGVRHATASARAAFAVAANGATLSFSRDSPPRLGLAWVDRSGKRLGTFGPASEIQGARLAPDNRRVAIVVSDQETGNRDIWTVDAGTGSMSRLTSHPATDWGPVWSPDGTSIVFSSDRNGRSSLFRKQAEPAAPEDMLLEASSASSTSGRFAADWSADGRFILFHEDVPRDVVTTDLWAMPLFGDRKPFPLLQTRFQEIDGRLSPNGRWLAYVSNESGVEDVYIKAFDRPDTHRVSPAGGREPVWKRDGRELFFLAAGDEVTAVAVSEQNGLVVGPPVPLFPMCGDGQGRPSNINVLNVASDGRFLVACPSASAPAPSVTLMVNWRSILDGRSR